MRNNKLMGCNKNGGPQVEEPQVEEKEPKVGNANGQPIEEPQLEEGRAAWIHNYEQARRFIREAPGCGDSYSLTNIQNLMARLGNVQERLSAIHVAGTNGKGSVCACICQILQEAGYRTGLYSSPAVFDEAETIRINGVPISSQGFVQAAAMVQRACAKMQRDGMAHPSAFEIETAVAFCCFYMEKCDYVVLETGMGGAKDATNIIRHPVCSVLTSISKDHMAFLGETLEEIAAEKAGIIKPGCPCVTAQQQPEVMDVLQRAANKAGSRLVVAIDGLLASYEYDSRESRLSLSDSSAQALPVGNRGSVQPLPVDNRGSSARPLLRGKCDSAGPLPVGDRGSSAGPLPAGDRRSSAGPLPAGDRGSSAGPLPAGDRGSSAGPATAGSRQIHCALTGAWQRQNIACALAAVRILQECGVSVPVWAVEQGLAKVRLPGRLERIHEKPDIYIDGAHNEGAALALKETVQNCFTNTKIVYIIGVLADKEYEAVLRLLLPFAAQVFTVTPENERALPGRALAAAASKYKAQVSYAPSVAQAARLAADAAGEQGVVLAFGSFSYLGKLKRAVEDFL